MTAPEITFNKPQFGQRDIVVGNAHFHHSTANKIKGFVAAREKFWDELAHISS